MGENILILSASAGAGHLRAAEAVELALKQTAPEAHVKNIDVLTLATKTFRHIYGRAYLDLVNRAPYVFGYFYDLFDHPKPENSKSDHFRIAIEKLNMHPFIKLLESEPWDMIINTHFLPAEIIASLRNARKLKTRHMTVTTDFETHRLWVHKPCEYYSAATDEGAEYLHFWGVPMDRIAVTGIPVHPVFSQDKDRKSCLENQGLQGNKPLILLLSGGFGVGPIESLYRGILDVKIHLEIVVLSGRNEELKQRLEKIRAPAHHLIKILGFTTEIDELMAVADIVVTKPGGLTTAETLARGAAMAIVNPIPGQESRNSDYLLENGAAIKINTMATLSYKLTKLLNDPNRLSNLKKNARAIGRPRAAFDIASVALAMARKRRIGHQISRKPFSRAVKRPLK